MVRGLQTRPASLVSTPVMAAPAFTSGMALQLGLLSRQVNRPPLTWINAHGSPPLQGRTRAKRWKSDELSDDAETRHRGCRPALADVGRVGRGAESPHASTSRRTGSGRPELP